MKDSIIGLERRVEMSVGEIKEFQVTRYGAKPDGLAICTNAIQQAIDAAASAGGGRVTFEKGVYLTGSIFVKSNVELNIPEGVELRGVVDESAYPEIWTRVAGIETNWPAGLVNVYKQRNVKITGKGIINGQGEYWWRKYWGDDHLGGMRRDYVEKGLRWAVDYDCTRPRNVIVYDSSEILLEGFTSIRSPFWNVHICYSTNVTVDSVIVRDNKGPSTDGIDVDSSSDVLVQNCRIECSDDNICIKAGRDADGLRVNRPSENIVVRNCELGAGGGVTIGSETSGGVRNVEIYNIRAIGTGGGFRLKSARTRGGLIENINVHDFEMIKVHRPFTFNLDWNPSYSYSAIPKDWQGEIPERWKVLTQPVEPPERGIPEFRNIRISNVTVKSISEVGKDSLPDRRRMTMAFEVTAYAEKPIHGLSWKDIIIEADTAGFIRHAKDWTMENVVVYTTDGKDILLENCENVELPKLEKKA